MAFIKKLKNLLYKTDFFQTIEFLRYKEQPQYRTLFGGVLSILILCLLLVTFHNKLIDTLDKLVIISISENSNAADPTPFTISTFSEHNFMFGVEVWHHDLNTGPRYFDIVLKNIQYDTGQQRMNSSIHSLETCTQEHWKQFPDVKKDFNRLNMNYWLCLPINSTYNLKGKYASQYSQTLQVSVQKCTNKSSQSRACASEAVIDQYFQDFGPFYFTIYFINPLINPSSKQYIKFYLQDNNYIIFTKNLGSQGILFMEEYQITTDQSILPFSQIHSQSGALINGIAIKNPYEITSNNNIYCSYEIFKSGTAWTHKRQFQKLDDLLAYIGGLFGIITIGLFIVNIYNSHSYQMNIAAFLFRKKSVQEQQNFQHYNFLNFIGHQIYEFFKSIGCSLEWKKIKQFQQCRKQMLKQLDIMYLLERVTFLQKIIDNVIQSHQLKGMHLHEKLSLEQAKQKRKNFKLKQKIYKFYNSQLNDQQNQQKHYPTTYNMDRIMPQFQQTHSSYGLSKSPVPLNMQNKITQFNDKQNSIKISSNQQIMYNQLLKKSYEIQYQSSQDEEQGQDYETLLNEISQLRKQAQIGNPISRKVWNKISHPLKGKLKIILKQEKNNFTQNKIDQQIQQKFYQSTEKQEDPINLNQNLPQQIQMNKPYFIIKRKSKSGTLHERNSTK